MQLVSPENVPNICSCYITPNIHFRGLIPAKYQKIQIEFENDTYCFSVPLFDRCNLDQYSKYFKDHVENIDDETIWKLYSDVMIKIDPNFFKKPKSGKSLI